MRRTPIRAVAVVVRTYPRRTLLVALLLFTTGGVENAAVGV
jgi:hypothetical protein